MPAKRKVKTLELPKTVELPMNFKEIGKVEPDDLKVYIHQSVIQALQKMAKKNIDKEVGSILIGDTLDYLNKKYVIVTNYIEAKYTDASNSSLTFTHETWEYIHNTRDKKFSDKKIIGWQHTHPNHGIFLSSYDLFIHENFFNLSFQTAYVIDPVQNTQGFFQWKNGKVVKMDGYFVFDENGVNLTDLDFSKPEKIEKAIINEKIILNIKLLAVCMGLSFVIFAFLLWNNMKLSNEAKTLRSKVTVLENSLDSQKTELANEITDLNEKITNFKNSDISSYTVLQLYQVKKGDTLSAILKKSNLEYDKYRNIVLGINRIKDENLIITGQIILLPISIDDITK